MTQLSTAVLTPCVKLPSLSQDYRVTASGYGEVSNWFLKLQVYWRFKLSEVTLAPHIEVPVLAKGGRKDTRFARNNRAKLFNLNWFCKHGW